MRMKELVGASIVAVVASLLAPAWSSTRGDEGAAGGGGSPEAGVDMNVVSYGIGHDLGTEVRAGLKRDDVEANVDMVVKGFAAALKDQKPEYDQGMLDRTLVAFQRVVQARKVEERMQSDPVFRALADENLRKSRDFLAAFAQREGAKKLDDGVLYIPGKSGDGPTAKLTDTVTLNYVGMLPTGYQFGSGVGAKIRVDALLPGGQETLQHMKVGDRWFVAVPPELAYGVAGRTPDIGPNQALVFDVELLGIE